MREELVFSVDVETDGSIPGDHSMLSVGACLVECPSLNFYRELKPISDNFELEALKVSGLDRAKLKLTGADPLVAMSDFANWVHETSGTRRPVFVSLGATFDWMFVHWYFIHFLKENPFGHSGLDIKAFYAGVMRKTRWGDTSLGKIREDLKIEVPHTHNALQDAFEQATIFQMIVDRAKEAM